MTARSLRWPTVLTLLLVLAPGTAAQEGAARAESDSVPLYDDLGSHGIPITTSVPRAQAYFDQGIRLYYAFNHPEAVRSFREAQRLDQTCAMCWWGEALAHGPNINLPMDSASGAAAHRAVRRAVRLKPCASEREGTLIDALAARYGPDPTRDRAALDSAYARAMGEVVARHPEDAEARTLYAEALMDLSPWTYWNRDGSPRPGTPEILEQLERVMAENPDHPGANHFYIHAVEAVHPERAVDAAERLAGLMPGAGHIVHMPGHIYVRVGRYMDAIRANEHAIHADESYIRDQAPAPGIYTVGYYPHNYDFLAFAASMVGRSEQAIGAAETMTTLAPDEMLRAPGMTVLQHHRTRHLQMKVRFGRWEEILAAPEPDADLLHARGMWHYARGRALAATGDAGGAETELRRLRSLAREPGLAGQRLEFNDADAVLGVAGEVLAAHVARARGDLEDAVGHLREAARREDELVYGEPPEWSVPVRQELGRVLLEAGRPTEAERAFRQDLDRFPENGWSLHGLARALGAQGRTAEAGEVRSRLAEAWREADVPLEAIAGR